MKNDYLTVWHECNVGHYKNERLYINITAQTIIKLAKYMNNVCFIFLGFHIRVGYNKMPENVLSIILKCYRGVYQRTSLSNCKQMTLVLPQHDIKCFWSLTLYFDR